MTKWIRSFLLMLLALTSLTIAAAAQNQQMQERVAELKQSMAQNQQALAQYQWLETVTISLKGEEKKQQHYQVRLGPDGKPQKTSLDPPPSSSSQDSGRRGRLKEHVVEKKTEEYQQYAEDIKSLIQQYLPPDKDKLQQAFQAGNLTIGSGGGPDEYAINIANYLKQGDKMTIVFNKAQHAITSVSIASYLNDPKDAVTVNAQFAAIPGGPNHVSSQTINGVSKQLTIAIQNSQYQHL